MGLRRDESGQCPSDEGDDSAGIVCYDGNRFRERKVWHAMLASCYK